MTILVQQQLHTAGGDWTIICENQGGPIARAIVRQIVQGKNEYSDTATAAANARRLVACWNACQGISTEQLEGWQAQHDQLKAENAELLSALQQAQMALTGYVPLHRNEITSAAIERAQAAIDQAMAKEQL